MEFSSESLIALVALAVSLLALCLTSIQLLTQIFATAEGTRKCSPSVLGEWGKFTRWKWRWSEGRFETFFTTPELFLTNFSTLFNPLNKSSGRVYPLTTTTDFQSLDRLIPPPSEKDETLTHPSAELASWISFLSTLRKSFRNAHISSTSWSSQIRTSWPCIRLRETSWDFMPPDAVRPLATSNVSDLAIIVRRMGLIWKEFDPLAGKMVAEAGPHILSSVPMRGLGIVLVYKFIDGGGMTAYKKYNNQLVGARMKSLSEAEDITKQVIHIHTADADKLIFGILAGDANLNVPDFCISTEADVKDTLFELTNHDPRIRRRLENNVQRCWPLHYELNDLILMAPPILRQRGSSAPARVPLMGEYNWSSGLLWHHVSQRVFCQRLHEYTKAHDGGTERLRQILSDSAKMCGMNEDYSSLGTNETIDLDYIHDLHLKTTFYFSDLERKGIRFYDVLKAHFSRATLAASEAWSRVKGSERAAHDSDGAVRPGDNDNFNDENDDIGLYKTITRSTTESSLTDEDTEWKVATMHIYFDNLPYYTRYLRRKGCPDDTTAMEAWVMLMFRGFCWLRCHDCSGFQGDFLPCQFYGSRVPVYLS